MANDHLYISEKEKEICKKLSVPLPTTPLDERFRTLMAFRNEWKLYRRTCDATGETILSAYHPDSPYKVYQNKTWWGDSWSALDYGQDYDFGKPFFDQFKELQRAVPREGTTIFNSENCEYNSHIRESRNCYLNSLVYKCEDLYYSYWMVNDKNVFDSLLTNESTLCYYNCDTNNCYECLFLEESNNCSNCHFSFQLRGCKNCIFSSNLANKEYYAFNKPCSKDEFEKIKAEYLNGSYKTLLEAKKKCAEIQNHAAQRYVHNLNCENCSGDHLYNCRNCENCYEAFNSEDCVNCISLGDATATSNCYSAGWPNCPGPVHMSLVTRAGQDIAYCNYTWFSSALRYCDSMNACNNCFGCIGLQHKDYCILNKQYTKEEYEKLIPKIIKHMESTGEWGEFFPPELSAFAYNETPAMDYFPLTKDEALKRGFKWREKDLKEYKPSTIDEIPDNIKNVDDNFTKEILACDTCKKNYRIIEQELKFYRLMNLPIPRQCPECRHQERRDKRNPFKLFTRTCASCSTPMESTYSLTRPETVYCEKCYLEAVY